jgi:hypothetical protein
VKFAAPIHSVAHQSLLAAAAAHELDVDALRRLLWLINAHPDLGAHAQVFENLHAIFNSDACGPVNLAWAGAWVQDIAAWKTLCNWISVDRMILSNLQ